MPQFAIIAVSILFDGLAYAMFLFITSVGLSVTMGLMGFVNLAHGAFAMAGGYIVVTLTRNLGIGFVPSLVIAAVVVGAVSVLFERGLYRRLYKSTDLEQVLLTIGLAFMAIATATYLYGPIPKSVPLPDWLQGDVNLGFRNFPSYRAFLIVLGVRAYRRALVRIRAHQYRRQDPRRGRQPAHGGIGRHQCRPAVHAHFRGGIGPCRARRRACHPAVRPLAELCRSLSCAVPDRGCGRRPRQPEGHACWRRL